MGGRGTSSGVSDKGKKYGTEYDTLLDAGDILFIRRKDNSASAPYETQAGDNRIYATVNKRDKIKFVTTHKDHKRKTQIDTSGPAHYDKKGNKINTPHAHDGYEHLDSDVRELNKNENKLVDKINKIWENKRRK